MAALIKLVLTALILQNLLLSVAAVRGQSRSNRDIHRALKKEDDTQDATPAPAPTADSAFESTNQKGGQSKEVLEEEGDPADEEIDEEDVEDEDQDNQESEGNDKDDSDKDAQPVEDDNGTNEEGAALESAVSVKLPVLDLVVGVELATSSRAGSTEDSSNNNDVIEVLLQDYFSTLLSSDIMGANYVASKLEATMSENPGFTAITGMGSLMDCKIKGTAEYLGEPVPSEEEIKEWLMSFFLNWGYDNELGTFLDSQGVVGTKAVDFSVEGTQMPAFLQPGISEAPADNEVSEAAGGSEVSEAVGGSEVSEAAGDNEVSEAVGDNEVSEAVGDNEVSEAAGENEVSEIAEDDEGSKPSESEVPEAPANYGFGDSDGGTIHSSQGNALSDEPNEGGKRFGLIVGLTLSMLCLLMAGFFLFRSRQEFLSGCGRCCKSVRENLNERRAAMSAKAVQRSWMCLDEGHYEDDAPKGDRDLKHPTEESTKPNHKWSLWFQRKKEKAPSDILEQIQIIINEDIMQEKDGVGYKNYSYPDDPYKHEHSSTTIPHANYASNIEDSSPAKTVSTSRSDDDEAALEDPVVRWAPPTRSKSKIYRATAPEVRKRAPKPDVTLPSLSETIEERVEVEAFTGVDWNVFLNPCTSFRTCESESERLDNLVRIASLPRDKSVFDSLADRSNDSIMPPSPTRGAVGPKQSGA